MVRTVPQTTQSQDDRGSAKTALHIACDRLELAVNELARILGTRSFAGHVSLQPKDTTRASSFKTEAEMLPILRKAASALWTERNPSRTWVMLEEQLMHSRIADLVLVRLDIDVFRERLEGGWLRPMGLAELRILGAVRPDRRTGVTAVARAVRMEPNNVRRILRTLSHDGFIARDGPNAYKRLAPKRAIAQRVISFEAKRDNPRTALAQARAHRVWAEETYVAFDSRSAQRFRAMHSPYAQAGIGLIQLSPDRWDLVTRSHARRRANRLEAALMGERALARLLGQPAKDRPERRLPHGHRLSRESEPVVSGADAELLIELTRTHASPRG